MLFGHLPEILLLLFVALLVFGPKRMIDMGSSFGKAFRELREVTKDMNLTSLLNPDETPATPKTYSAPRPAETAATSAQPTTTIVEGSVEPIEEPVHGE